MNKKQLLILSLILFLSLFLNHIKYGNSDITISNIERIEAINRSRQITKKSKGLAEYMYERIQFYQKYDTWYESYMMLWDMYEVLQNTEIN